MASIFEPVVFPPSASDPPPVAEAAQNALSTPEPASTKPVPGTSGRALVQEDTAEGTFVRTDLTPDYRNAPWPMLPPGAAAGTVERFYRTFVHDRSTEVFVVYDRVIVRPPVTLFRFRPGPGGPWPSAPFVQGYFAPMAPGALGLEVRNLMPALPAADGASRSAWGTGTAFPLSTDLTPEPSELMDAPFLAVLRYTDAAASELRTSLARSRGGDAMTGVRVQTGAAPRYFFFNAAPGAQPAPITRTELPAEPHASWVLFGFKPGASYAVSLEGRTLVITERAGATHTASMAGVLRVGAPIQGQTVPAFTYTLAEPGPVRVALCDTSGSEVAVLADGIHTPGPHAVPLVGVLPGEYVVQVVSPGAVGTQKITVPG